MQQCLVTGANRGLGLALVCRLLADGAHVVACCRNVADAGELAQLASNYPPQLQVEALDVADARAINALPARLATRLRRLDLLINNAGVLISGERFGNVQAQDLASSFAVNASAPVLLTQALTPLLRQGRQPRVLCISSQLGSIAQARAFRTVSYAMSKAALNMAVKRLAAELAGHGITVLALHPGWLATRMGGDGASLDADTSAGLLLELAARCGVQDSGRFLAHDGATLPW